MRQAFLLICLLWSAGSSAQQTVPITVVSGYPPTALWVEMFRTHFIPEADRQLGATGHYAIDWNTPFGSLTRPSGAFEAVQYGVADIGIITTSFHSDKIPFYNISYVTPFVTTDIGLVVRTVSDLHERYPALKQLWSDYRQVYLVDARLGAVSSVALSANERTWNRLPGEVRQALLAAAEVYRDALAQETVRRSEQAMASFQSLGGTIIALSDEQRRAWAASVPDLAGAWVTDIERRGLPGTDLLSAYMDTMRDHGQPIMRHWDRE